MLLVGERFGLEVPSSPGEVRERLERVPAAFTGTVSDDAFRLSGVLGYRNAFAPIAHGSFRTGVAGTRVDVKLRLRPAVAVFTAAWLTFIAVIAVVVLVAAARDRARWWAAPLPFGMLALGWGLAAWAFSVEARRMRENLTRVIVCGCSASELSRVDLSWLTFRARGAEPPERVFNRVFLAAFGISGILSVLAWDQLATACSNGESRQPERFACPGDSRFVLTWSLVVLVVGACWGSRLALHRKARRSYLPLVVFVVLSATGHGRPNTRPAGFEPAACCSGGSRSIP
jgi:hypothetical protein